MARWQGGKVARWQGGKVARWQGGKVARNDNCNSATPQPRNSHHCTAREGKNSLQLCNFATLQLCPPATPQAIIIPMTDSTSITTQELDDLRNRMTWFDEERRKVNRRLSEVDQRMEAQTRAIEMRDARIQKLEEQLAVARSKLKAVNDIDIQFVQLRKEMINLIDRVDDKRHSSTSESDRLREVERQITNRELSEIRKQLPAITRLNDQIEQRKLETTRLHHVISSVQNSLPTYDTRIDKISSGVTYLEETMKQLQRQFSKLEATHLELGKRIEANRDQLSSFTLSIGRMESSLAESSRDQVDARRKLREWLEQARTADYDRSQRIATWQAEFEAYQKDMQRFHREHLRMADQAGEARVLVQSLEEWRKQIELQQRESAELARIEAQRISTQWETFRSENEKFQTKVELDSTQKQASLDRRLRELTTLLHETNEKLAAIEQEKDTLYRIQTAQSDAMKRFPRLWLEEVEKAIANDPNRRRSAASVPTPDDEF